MEFAWNDFGVMATPEEDDRYLYAVNVAGDRRKMSKGKYPNWVRIREKLIMLEGKNCIVRTSQNTANWSTSIWFSDVSFSDVSLDDGEQDLLPIRGDEQETESVEELKNKILKLENQVQEQGDAIRQKDEQLLKKEDRLQDEMAKNNELSAKFAEADLQISKLQGVLHDLTKDLPEREQEQIKKDQEDLDKKNLVGGRRRIRVRGHPKNTLALRLGVIIENDNLEVEIAKSLGEGRFQVHLVKYEKTGIVALGYDSKKDKIYAKTFFNMRADWFNAERKITGTNEAALKDRTDISLEKFLEYHHKILTYLSEKAQ